LRGNGSTLSYCGKGNIHEGGDKTMAKKEPVKKPPVKGKAPAPKGKK